MAAEARAASTRLTRSPRRSPTFTWRHARSLLAARGADDTNDSAISVAVQQAALPDRDRSRPARHSPHPPIILAPAALQQLTDEQRLQYDTAREHYHARLVIVSTPTIRHVAQLRYDPDADPCRTQTA